MTSSILIVLAFANLGQAPSKHELDECRRNAVAFVKAISMGDSQSASRLVARTPETHAIVEAEIKSLCAFTKKSRDVFAILQYSSSKVTTSSKTVEVNIREQSKSKGVWQFNLPLVRCSAYKVPQRDIRTGKVTSYQTQSAGWRIDLRKLSEAAPNDKSVLLPALTQTSSRLMNRWCELRLKRVGGSLSMYLADSADHFPKFSVWHEATQPYFRKDWTMTSFKCPVSGLDYLFNQRLSGRSASEIEEPLMTALVYENAGMAHFGGVRVYTVGGSVRSLAPEELPGYLRK